MRFRGIIKGHHVAFWLPCSPLSTMVGGAVQKSFQLKKELYLVAFARPKASLDGVGVALKVKVRQRNKDIASSRLRRRYFD